MSWWTAGEVILKATVMDTPYPGWESAPWSCYPGGIPESSRESIHVCIFSEYLSEFRYESMIKLLCYSEYHWKSHLASISTTNPQVSWPKRTVRRMHLLDLVATAWDLEVDWMPCGAAFTRKTQLSLFSWHWVSGWVQLRRLGNHPNQSKDINISTAFSWEVHRI